MSVNREQGDRVERRLAARRRARAALRLAKPRPPVTGPVEIPSEARMLRNLERAWDDAEPGEDGLTVDRPLRHPTF